MWTFERLYNKSLPWKIYANVESILLYLVKKTLSLHRKIRIFQPQDNPIWKQWRHQIIHIWITVRKALYSVFMPDMYIRLCLDNRINFQKLCILLFILLQVEASINPAFIPSRSRLSTPQTQSLQKLRDTLHGPSGRSVLHGIHSVQQTINENFDPHYHSSNKSVTFGGDVEEFDDFVLWGEYPFRRVWIRSPIWISSFWNYMHLPRSKDWYGLKNEPNYDQSKRFLS